MPPRRRIIDGPLTADEILRVERVRDMLEPHFAPSVECLAVLRDDPAANHGTRRQCAADLIRYYVATIGVGVNGDQNITIETRVITQEQLDEISRLEYEANQEKLDRERAEERH